jgi:hypothetical protein
MEKETTLKDILAIFKATDVSQVSKYVTIIDDALADIKPEPMDIEYQEVKPKVLGTQTKHTKDTDRFYPEDL